MYRRTVLKSIAALPLRSLAPALAVQAAPTGAALRRMRPADAAWPGAAVGGNLLQVHALFGACESAPDGAACQDVYRNIRNPFYIGDQPGGTQVSGFLNAWTPAPSVWAVRARSATDVAAAVNFARTHNLRLVVKGGAHSYFGTSNAPDSLLSGRAR